MSRKKNDSHDEQSAELNCVMITEGRTKTNVALLSPDFWPLRPICVPKS